MTCAPGTVVIAAALARRPARGGHTWAILQYLLGFRRLGWRVMFLDRLEDPRAGSVTDVVRTLRQHGLDRDFAVFDGDGGTLAGLSRAAALDRVGEADVFVNVMGYVRDEDVLARARRRVFLDIDPGYPQMWHALGLADVLDGHDVYATVGANIGSAGCTIPTCGRRWIATRPPVVLGAWPVAACPGGAFTTVATWRGPYGPVEHDGKSYGSRVHQFRRFATLPSHAGAEFELALDIDDAETTDLSLLHDEGWRLVDPLAVARDGAAYRDYVHRSRAEFAVAQGMYVQTWSGWFSDRSACYLASGKPVVAQDTGFSDALPIGEGLLAFTSLDGAVEAVAEVEAHYDRHSREARRLAEAYFDSDVVLARLVDRVGAG